MKHNINNPHIINGVSYHHAGGGKWHFVGTDKNGQSFTKIETVRGRENAAKVANIIGGGLKRNKAGGIDAMARVNIHRVLAPSAKNFKGINFSQAFPLNPKH